MNTRNALILSFALVLCCVILRGSEGQDFRPKSQRQPVAGEIGRYQVGPSGQHDIVVIDTTTGQVWENRGSRWYDMKSPVERAPAARHEGFNREAQEEVKEAPLDAAEAVEDAKRDAAEAVKDARRDAAK